MTTSDVSVGVKTRSRSGRPVRVDLKVDLHPSLHQRTLEALLRLPTGVLQVRHPVHLGMKKEGTGAHLCVNTGICRGYMLCILCCCVGCVGAARASTVRALIVRQTAGQR